jgi:colanic acid/amylovoran biosynthesis glycosyltransferase
MSASRPIRICVACPAHHDRIETFIRAHIDGLNEVALVLTHGHLPAAFGNGQWLLGDGPIAKARAKAVAFLHRDGWRGVLRDRIVRELAAQRIGLLLAEFGTAAHALIEVSQRAGVPLVAHFHGADAHKHVAIASAGGYKALFEAAAALVVVSRAMEQQLIGLGAPREKVIYNCYGIDVQRFTAGDPEQAPPVFVAVGRFVEKKAPLTTLSAFAKMLVQVPEARLIMVGNGPLWEDCQAFVRAQGIERNVDLCGVRTPVEIAELMRSARAFVQHSVQAVSGDMEGTPLAVLEAMASGIPVVATRHAGIADVVEHEKHGLLCDEHDVEAMAMNLVLVARDPRLAGELGRAGRAKAEREHRVEDSIAGLQAILERVARK